MKGDRARLARIGLGLSQQQLAQQVGVSRQAIAAIEAGITDPSLRVALALARALSVAVEDLFSPTLDYPEVAVTSIAPQLAASRADLAWVGGRPVALPLAGDHGISVGFSAAGGVIDTGGGRGLTVTPNRETPPALVIAGCDPALALLPSIFAHLEPRMACLWWPATNGEALKLLRDGLVHVAGFHLADGIDYPSVDAKLFFFARWREGVAYRSTIPTPELIEQGFRLANRQLGSEARHMVDQFLGDLGVTGEMVAGYDSSVSAHTLVGSALASRVADFGVTIEPVALEFGLQFQPYASEDFLLAIPEALVATAEARTLFRALTSQELRSQLAAIRGYLQVERSGEPIA